jgi:hypothetical protein
VSVHAPALEQVRSELVRIRRAQALARPTVLLELSPQLRGYLLGDQPRHGETASQITALAAVLRNAVESVNPEDRAVLEADFNLAAEHAVPTLTERRQSLAAAKHVSFRTITRTADKALDTLTLALVTLHQAAPVPNDEIEVPRQAIQTSTEDSGHWRDELARFWGLRPSAQVDIVCSEIPQSQRPPFAHPQDRNYVRYARFADLDSLIYVRTSLACLNGDTPVRDYASSEYHEPHDSQADRQHVLIIVGGPPSNATYSQFQRHLPCGFELHAEGEDRSLLVPTLGLTLRPHWTPDQELVEDLAVFARLTFARGLTVFLLAGCLAFGVLVAAQCFLHRELGASNVRYAHNHAGGDDFILLTEARRFGDITDVPDLATAGPLLLMSRRDKTDPFTALVDNSSRYER